MKNIGIVLFATVLLSLSVLSGCGGGPSDPAASPVTIQKIDGLYYRVDVNMPGMSHYDMGRQYALAIQNAVPNFEWLLDSLLVVTIHDLTEASDIEHGFDDLEERAEALYENLPEEYQQEIQGMQSVFSSTDDSVGNGKLSQNKLLVYELAPDIARIVACSASAAFGSGTPSGNTVLVRNLEWHDDTMEFLTPIQTVALLHNGSKSIVLFGFLGQLFGLSALSANNVFAAVLDSDIEWPYPPVLDTERSFVMDLRYALENQTSIQAVAAYLTGKDHPYGFNAFLADKTTSANFEDDPVADFSGLRTATSALKPGIPLWPYSDALAVVNWFTLPGTTDNTDVWIGNLARWNSFINLYANAFAGGGKVDINVMKQITSYPGPNGNGKGAEGAIWRYDDEGESNVQSIIMDMGTLETWVAFHPEGPALHSPNYTLVFQGSPF